MIPGTYTVRVKYGEHAAEGKVRVVPDPRIERTEADRRANDEAVLRTGALQDSLVAAIERVVRTREDVDAVTARVRRLDEEAKRKAAGGEASTHKALLDSARDLRKKLDDLERRMRVPEDANGILPEIDVESKLQFVTGSLTSSWDAPTAAQLTYLANAETLLQGVIADLNRLFAEDVAAFRTKVKEAGVTELLPEGKPL